MRVITILFEYRHELTPKDQGVLGHWLNRRLLKQFPYYGVDWHFVQLRTGERVIVGDFWGPGQWFKKRSRRKLRRALDSLLQEANVALDNQSLYHLAAGKGKDQAKKEANKGRKGK